MNQGLAMYIWASSLVVSGVRHLCMQRSEAVRPRRSSCDEEQAQGAYTRNEAEQPDLQHLGADFLLCTPTEVTRDLDLLGLLDRHLSPQLWQDHLLARLRAVGYHLCA